MSSQRGTVRIIDSIDVCKEVVTELLRKNEMISVDSSGVNPGKEGPPTVLQVGTVDDHVLLFDILTGGPQMFTSGRLKELLESESILKVMHGSSRDSLALHSHFNVELHNVFDNQVAHIVLEEEKGRLLVYNITFNDICKIYIGDTSFMLDKKVDILAVPNIKRDKNEDAEYWAKRPLTQDMIDYANGTLLLIQIYREIKKKIDSAGLTSKLKEQIIQALRSRYDKAVMKAAYSKMKEIVKGICQNMEQKYQSNPDVNTISDEERTALQKISLNELDSYSATIKTLKYQLIEKEVLEIRDKMQEQGEQFIPTFFNIMSLKDGMNVPDKSINTLSEQLQKSCWEITETDMAVKYTLRTPLQHVSYHEKSMLRRLRPNSSTDPRYHAVVLRLYWLLMEQGLHQQFDKFRVSLMEYKVHQGYVQTLKFYLSASGVPVGVKNRAKTFLTALQNAGKVAPPQRRSFNRYECVEDYDDFY